MENASQIKLNGTRISLSSSKFKLKKSHFGTTVVKGKVVSSDLSNTEVKNDNKIESTSSDVFESKAKTGTLGKKGPKKETVVQTRDSPLKSEPSKVENIPKTPCKQDDDSSQDIIFSSPETKSSKNSTSLPKGMVIDDSSPSPKSSNPVNYSQLISQYPSPEVQKTRLDILNELDKSKESLLSEYSAQNDSSLNKLVQDFNHVSKNLVNSFKSDDEDDNFVVRKRKRTSAIVISSSENSPVKDICKEPSQKSPEFIVASESAQSPLKSRESPCREDRSSFKKTPVKSPRKSTEDLSEWISNKSSQPVMKISLANDEEQLKSSLTELQQIDQDILEKAFLMLVRLPEYLASELPECKGDGGMLKKFKMFRLHVKAKIKQTSSHMKRCRLLSSSTKKTPEVSSFEEDDDDVFSKVTNYGDLSSSGFKKFNSITKDEQKSSPVRKSSKKSLQFDTVSEKQDSVISINSTIEDSVNDNNADNSASSVNVSNLFSISESMGTSTPPSAPSGGFKLKKPSGILKGLMSKTVGDGTSAKPPINDSVPSDFSSPLPREDVVSSTPKNSVPPSKPCFIPPKLFPEASKPSRSESPATSSDYDNNPGPSSKINFSAITNSKFTSESKPSSSTQGESSPWFPSNKPVANSNTFQSLDSVGCTSKQVNNDSSAEFKSTNYPHSAEMMRVFRQKFGLHKFRPNQMEAINAALLGHDCFVLMPTGGGKSLCYQLPGVLTKGVTVVISPLRSLILDQTEKLKGLDIPAACLTTDVSQTVANNVYYQLSCFTTEPDLKFLFVTPEKLSNSDRLMSLLQALYDKDVLGRFVIDEAHCISQWGHDFRPDYKKLKNLRVKFPKVPFIALTATATPRVRKDILHQLELNSPKWFLSSFDRPNLKYEVFQKTGKNVVPEIVAMLKTKFTRVSGIIYCLSRNDCDNVAMQLRTNNIKAAAYHAGLSDTQRTDIQTRWISDKISVVCATIAFGMGIDKPDVRYVIHYSIPKSVEGYYQEAGRAGRDGEKANCILYYNYHDMHRVRKLIEMDREGNPAAKQTHIDNLWRMVAYCENKTECRRVMQMNYFGEKFSRDLCKSRPSTVCDNCSKQDQFMIEDVTPLARQIVTCVQRICGDTRNTSWGNNFTFSHIVDILKGSAAKKVLNSGHDQLTLYGAGKSWHRSDAERLLHKLTLDGFLEEIHIATKDNIVNTYTKLGRRAPELLNGTAKITLAMSSSTKKSEVAAKNALFDDEENDEEIKSIEESCYNALFEKVKDIALGLHVNSNSIMNTAALKEMSRKMPSNESEMLNIVGVTKANFEKYGKTLLNVIEEYACLKTVVLAERMLEGGNEDGGSVSETDSRSSALEPDCIGSARPSPYTVGPAKKYTGKRKATYRGRGAKRRKKSGSPRKGKVFRKKTTGTGTKGNAAGNLVPKVLPSDRKGMPPARRPAFIPLPKVTQF